jgi:hypothetical protein
MDLAHSQEPEGVFERRAVPSMKAKISALSNVSIFGKMASDARMCF